jgi:hypothetical protein
VKGHPPCVLPGDREQVEAHEVCGSVGDGAGQSPACGEPSGESIEIEPASVEIPTNNLGVDYEIAGESSSEHSDKVREVPRQIFPMPRPQAAVRPDRPPTVPLRLLYRRTHPGRVERTCQPRKCHRRRHAKRDGMAHPNIVRLISGRRGVVRGLTANLGPPGVTTRGAASGRCRTRALASPTT